MDWILATSWIVSRFEAFFTMHSKSFPGWYLSLLWFIKCSPPHILWPSGHLSYQWRINWPFIGLHPIPCTWYGHNCMPICLYKNLFAVAFVDNPHVQVQFSRSTITVLLIRASTSYFQPSTHTATHVVLNLTFFSIWTTSGVVSS